MLSCHMTLAWLTLDSGDARSDSGVSIGDVMIAKICQLLHKKSIFLLVHITESLNRAVNNVKRLHFTMASNIEWTVFGVTVCKTVRPMLSVRCPVCLSVCLSVTFVYCPNGWTDQDETWHAGRPRPWLQPHCVRWGPSSHPEGHSPPIFGPCLLWPNSWMD